jgi:hypothetical protein
LIEERRLSSVVFAKKSRHRLCKNIPKRTPDMAAATAQAPPPLRANHELESEKPSNASSLAEAPLAPREAGLFSRRRILGPVVKEYGDYGLLATSLVTGMVDGASFLNWGVFVGMQTGKLLCTVDGEGRNNPGSFCISSRIDIYCRCL